MRFLENAGIVYHNLPRLRLSEIKNCRVCSRVLFDDWTFFLLCSSSRKYKYILDNYNKYKINALFTQHKWSPIMMTGSTNFKIFESNVFFLSALCPEEQKYRFSVLRPQLGNSLALTTFLEWFSAVISGYMKRYAILFIFYAFFF